MKGSSQQKKIQQTTAVKDKQPIIESKYEIKDTHCTSPPLNQAWRDGIHVQGILYVMGSLKIFYTFVVVIFICANIDWGVTVKLFITPYQVVTFMASIDSGIPWPMIIWSLCLEETTYWFTIILQLYIIVSVSSIHQFHTAWCKKWNWCPKQLAIERWIGKGKGFPFCLPYDNEKIRYLCMMSARTSQTKDLQGIQVALGNSLVTKFSESKEIWREQDRIILSKLGCNLWT